MPIYKGSTKLGTVYHGGTKIEKVYKGSTLVYSSGTKTLPIYSIGINRFNRYCLSLEYPYPNKTIKVVFSGAADLTEILYTITSINGTLGTSGSSITVTGISGNLSFSNKSIIEVGLPFYVYTSSDSLYNLQVSPKQRIGDKVIIQSLVSGTVSSDGKTITTKDYITDTFSITLPISVATNIYYRS